jgi:2,3-bisphosphoglycerate-independent phosphoglycerate mutase
MFAQRPGPIVLCIMDGVGYGSGGHDDAVARAHTPNLDQLLATCPNLRLNAHGTWVGLPSDADMGNSEVGHNAMGAGRVFDQGAKLVDRALTGPAWTSEVWAKLIKGNTLHLLGLVSDGNVHSHIDHLNLLIERAAKDGVARLRLHILTDGRDVEPRSALTWVEPLEASFKAHRLSGRDYRIASGGGRMNITMDRYDADWDMVARGWRCHVAGEGRFFASAAEAIHAFYAEDPEVSDQWLPAFVIVDDEVPVGTIEDRDSVLFFNFRGDRAIQISRAFEEAELTIFDRGPCPDVYYAGMMQYDGDLQIPGEFLVAPPNIERTVGEFLAAAGRRTLACSETQKFGHVTYFFNGNRSSAFDDALETWVEVPSEALPFHERPWMKAAEISDIVVPAIVSGKYEHIRLNYANGDMVGHTGVLNATIVAVEAVDLQLGRLMDAVRRADGVLLVTADHGNADEMYMRKKGDVVTGPWGPTPRTSHTLNQVPFIVFDPRSELQVVPGDHSLAAIGGTLLWLCGLNAPEDYVPRLLR